MKKLLFTLLFFISVFCISAYAAEGVVNTTASIGGGSANLVYVDMSSSSRTGAAVISSQVQPASASSLIGKVSDGKVVAAMNGGFFDAYYNALTVSYPDNYPKIYGTVISEGRVLNGGGTGPALVFDLSGTPHIGSMGVSYYLEVNGSDKIHCSVNTENADVYTEDMQAAFYVSEGTNVTYVKNGVVTGSVECQGTNLKTEEGMMIVLGEKGLEAGDLVEIKYDASLDGEAIDAQTIISCGPKILTKGENVTTSISSAYDEKQSADSVAQRSFAAIAPDGRLILGEVSSSPNKIASYLQTLGVQEAMLFDGGASSMLYSSDRGFIQSAGRNLASIFVIVDKYETDNSLVAEPSAVNVKAGGSVFNVQAYNIDNNNYFKLRDIAYMLKDTENKISVGWDAEANTITVTSGSTDDFSGYSMAEEVVRTKAALSSSAVVVNGTAASLTAYNIDGSNYFKLRDIAELIGVSVSWDQTSSTITLE
ncbi:MAG: phosphodiester glycosidase family protein [Clostridiales bacterium]|nr:phosphodiester glycosidase family protein [Clostridiales bacterium]